MGNGNFFTDGVMMGGGEGLGLQITAADCIYLQLDFEAWPTILYVCAHQANKS